MLPLFDETIESGGYRYLRSEFLNWGTFDSLWEINPNGKSSLLTGSNGSGKTTIVDVINTLLVPPTVRHYNQSSGAIRKRERTEESYVLGAYGNIKEDDSSYVKVQYLRDKSTYSVLTGVFFNKTNNRYVSLGQIRYFTNSGLTKVYFISTENLELEKDILPFDNRGEYKRRLTKRGTKFFDSFTGYSAMFIKEFGFKSSKALNLFSQTVGVKVLGDINEFIRTHMLEKGNSQEKFDGLYQNFLHLLNTQKLIEKAELELELLGKVNTSGIKYVKYRDEIISLDQKMELFDYFTTLLKLEKSIILRKESTKKLDSLNTQTRGIISSIEAISNQIRETQRTLDSNTSAEQLRSIDAECKNLRDRISDKKRVWEQYNYFAKVVGITPPTELTLFNKLKVEQEKNLIDLNFREGELQEEYYKLRKDTDSLTVESRDLKNEFDSLKNRDSNIPFKSVEIRDRIAKGVGLHPEDLPFVGECIRIKDSESQWEKGIEKVLHSFSLSILIDKEYYNRVSRYINENNLRGRVVYFRVTVGSENLFSKKIEADSLINKVVVKSSSQFKEWLTIRLQERFNYICTDDLNLFSRLDYGLTSNGLIKRGSRHEKDDREFDTFVLGWDNLRKRARLEKDIITISKKIAKHKHSLEDLSLKRDDIGKKSSAISTILNYTFESMDFKSHEIELKELDSRRTLLLASATDLRKLENELESLNKKEKKLRTKENSLNGEIAVLNHKVGMLTSEIEECNSFIDSTVIDEGKEKILDALTEEFSKKYNSESIVKYKNDIQHLMREVQNREKAALATVLNAMGSFVHPKKNILIKFPSWNEDIRDLLPEIEYLNDYRELYNRVLKNDLPKHKKKFKEFLNQRVMEDMASFQQSLNDELSLISESIRELNRSLKGIRYQESPGTYITLNTESSKDVAIRDFQRELKNTFADGYKLASGDFKEMELFFEKSKKLLTSLKEDENKRRKVLDVRGWLNFSAEERYIEDNVLKQVYQDSQSLSGGEKAKLAYTVLASAIAYQFGIESKGNSFRFVVVDEAFSKVDPANSKFAMNLFKKLDLQLMVVTPLDRIGLVEEYIDSVHYVEKGEGNKTMVYNMEFKEFSDKKEIYKDDNLR